jgi:uncharacterized protein YdeI (YjbR/CyaY-like superfamily)
MRVTYFKTPREFRRWLQQHHATVAELWVGFHKKDSGKPSITYPEALDEALCFGWIDGVRKRVNETSYTNRFTPRRERSNWSHVNIKRANELTALGRMAPAGLRAFEARSPSRSPQYSYEQQKVDFTTAYEAIFRANASAWTFFTSQAPWYQRVARHFVSSAKRDVTRERRLALLIDASARGQRFGIIGGESSATTSADRSARSRSGTRHRRRASAGRGG